MDGTLLFMIRISLDSSGGAWYNIILLTLAIIVMTGILHPVTSGNNYTFCVTIISHVALSW
jgi:hypothetical protein